MSWREHGDVISTILMVVLTVILAAVIGTYVLGLGSNVESGNVPAESVSDGVGSQGVDSVFVGDGVRRFVDREAGVVCYRSDQLKGTPDGLSCLPLNDTRLGGGSR